MGHRKEGRAPHRRTLPSSPACMPESPGRLSMTIDESNDLDQEAFVGARGALVEGSPWIVAEACRRRPFDSIAHLHSALCAVMHNASTERQVALIRAHPDLVGKAALMGTLTPESTREQAAAGLGRLSAEEIATFTRLNQAYRDKFGFPFVICARENKKESILAGFQARLGNDRDQ